MVPFLAKSRRRNLLIIINLHERGVVFDDSCQNCAKQQETHGPWPAHSAGFWDNYNGHLKLEYYGPAKFRQIRWGPCKWSLVMGTPLRSAQNEEKRIETGRQKNFKNCDPIQRYCKVGTLSNWLLTKFSNNFRKLEL